MTESMTFENIFLSHSGADTECVKHLNAYLEKQGIKCFFSNNEERAKSLGEQLYPMLNSELKKSDCFLAVITENYLRSPYCMYEMSVFNYLNENEDRKMFLLADSQKHLDRLTSVFTGLKSLVSETAGSKTILGNLKNSLGYNKNGLHELNLFLEGLKSMEKSSKPYIFMDEAEYQSILGYCEKGGIVEIRDRGFDIGSILEGIDNP